MRTIVTVGIPMDLGQSRRGVDMGPSALRYAGLGGALRALGFESDDRGNVEIPERETLPPEGGSSFLLAAVGACTAMYEVARWSVSEGHFPLFLGGDHSLALGTIAGITEQEPAAVLWIDAHGDLNTPETSPSGNLHGMPLAALLGRGAPEMTELGRPGAKIEPRDVALVGVRDLDPGERDLIHELDLAVYTMREIDERGMSAVAQEALERLSHRRRLHVSFDLDCIDPSQAPGVGTPVRGGINYREAHLLMEILGESGRICSADVVEVNPILDERNRTAELAVDLVASLLGKRIL